MTSEENKEVWEWLKEQTFQTEQGEQEYRMYYDIDMTEILQGFHKWKLSQMRDKIVKELEEIRDIKYINQSMVSSMEKSISIVKEAMK
jgi:hypothetical protein